MATTPARRIVEVIYVSGEDSRYNNNNKTYHYYVPNSIKGDIKIDDLVIVQAGSGEQLFIAKVRAVLLDSERAPRAQRKVIAIVDISHHLREMEAIGRRAELLAALEDMEKKRQQLARFKELAAVDADAAVMLKELRTLDAEVV